MPLPNSSSPQPLSSYLGTVDVAQLTENQDFHRLKRLWTMLLDGRVLLTQQHVVLGTTAEFVRYKGQHNPLRPWFLMGEKVEHPQPWWCTDLGWDDEVNRLALDLAATLSLDMLERTAGEIFPTTARPEASLLDLTVWFNVPTLFEALVARGLDPCQTMGGSRTVLAWITERADHLDQPHAGIWRRWKAYYESDALQQLVKHPEDVVEPLDVEKNQAGRARL